MAISFEKGKCIPFCQGSFPEMALKIRNKMSIKNRKAQPNSMVLFFFLTNKIAWYSIKNCKLIKNTTYKKKKKKQTNKEHLSFKVEMNNVSFQPI